MRRGNRSDLVSIILYFVVVDRLKVRGYRIQRRVPLVYDERMFWARDTETQAAVKTFERGWCKVICFDSHLEGTHAQLQATAIRCIATSPGR